MPRQQVGSGSIKVESKLLLLLSLLCSALLWYIVGGKAEGGREFIMAPHVGNLLPAFNN